MKKTTDTDTGALRERMHGAITKCVDYLIKHPEKSIDLWSHIETVNDKMKKQQQAATASSSLPLALPAASPTKEFDDSIGKSFGKMSVQTKIRLLSQLEDGAPSVATLNKIDDVDHMAVNDIFTRVLGISMHDVCPKEMVDFHTLLLAMKERMGSVGRSIKDFISKCMKDNFEIDFGKSPLFFPTYNKKGVLITLEHASGDAVKLERCEVDHTWDFLDAMSDDLARFAKGKMVRSVKDWFDEGAGPNKVILGKKCTVLREMAKRARSKIEDAGKSFQGVLATGEDVTETDRMKRVREEALQKARDKAAERYKGLKVARKQSTQLAIEGAPAADEAP